MSFSPSKSGPVTVTVTTTAQTATIQLIVSPAQSGNLRVEFSGQGVETSSSTTATIPIGASAKFIASPATGFQFVNFTGTGGSTTQNPFTVTIDSSGTVQANFQQGPSLGLPFPLAASIEVRSSASLSSTQPEYVECGAINCSSVCTTDVLPVPFGTQVSVTGIVYQPQSIGDSALNSPHISNARVDLYVGNCKQGSGGGLVTSTTSNALGSYSIGIVASSELQSIVQTSSVPTFYVKVTDSSGRIGWSREIRINLSTAPTPSTTATIDLLVSPTNTGQITVLFPNNTSQQTTTEKQITVLVSQPLLISAVGATGYAFDHWEDAQGPSGAINPFTLTIPSNLAGQTFLVKGVFVQVPPTQPPPTATQVTFSASPTSGVVPLTVQVSGNLSRSDATAVVGATILIVVNNQSQLTLTTKNDGTFTGTIQFTTPNVYVVGAEFQGTSTLLPSMSVTIPINVVATKQCSSNSDCPQGFKCQNGTCVPVTQQPGIDTTLLALGIVGAATAVGIGVAAASRKKKRRGR